MSKPSFKKVAIGMLAAATELEGLSGNKLILVTAAGVITGKVCKVIDGPDSSDGKSKGLIPGMLELAAEEYKTEHGIEGSLECSDGYMVLENVTLKTATGEIFRFDQLFTFYDQIISATLGVND